MAQATGAGSHNKESLQQMYMDYLVEEGFRPEIDGDGDVHFKKEGRSYYIIVNETDLEYFRLIFPSYWKIEDENERMRVLVAAEVANRTSKVAKTFIVGDSVTSCAELFVAEPEQFRHVFNRALAALEHGVSTFAGKMKE